MSAYDQLERQLRTSVAHRRGREASVWLRHWPRPRGVSSLLIAASCAVVLGVASFALVSLHHRRSATPPSPPSATQPRRFPRPPTPGPIPPHTDDAVIAASFNMAVREDPACGPGSAGPFATVSQGTPGAAILATVPVLRQPATTSDRLPADYDIDGRLRGPFRGGEVYIRYVRLARVVDGTRFYLVPIAYLGRPPLSQTAAARCYRLMVAALRAQLAEVPRTPARASTLRYATSVFASARWNLAHSSVYEGVSLLYQFPGGGGGERRHERRHHSAGRHPRRGAVEAHLPTRP